MKREHFLKMLAAMPLISPEMNLNTFNDLANTFSNTKKTPLLFIGHGHPINALLNNEFTQKLSAIGKKIERPNAIMVVSAHWETRGTFVSVNSQPKTIYDFGGFDKRLFAIKYEPQGHPALAKQVVDIAKEYHIQEDQSMGLDHGAWTILKYLFPKADVPVFQLSIDYTKPSAYHYQLANALKKLREKGVLIIGSGNIVHNLRTLDWSNIHAKPQDWAIEFDELVKSKLNKQDFTSLVNYGQLGRLAQMAIPTNDHYLPMIYALGLADKTESVKYLFEGIHYGSISMRCFEIS